MTHIVTDKCVKCKLADCIESCPVDCFYEGKEMLYIDPDSCINCGVCVYNCPIDAIVDFIPEEITDQKMKTSLMIMADINAKCSMESRQILENKDQLPNADLFRDVGGKLLKHKIDKSDMNEYNSALKAIDIDLSEYKHLTDDGYISTEEFVRFLDIAEIDYSSYQSDLCTKSILVTKCKEIVDNLKIDPGIFNSLYS